MRISGKIIIGLVILVIAATVPIWYSMVVGGPGTPPEVELPADATHCVEGRHYMAAEHMKLLNEWRDAVVREGGKTYKSAAFGEEYEMSLTETCMDCHSNKDTFCDKCHEYADVDPYCWDCHIEPEGQ